MENHLQQFKQGNGKKKKIIASISENYVIQSLGSKRKEAENEKRLTKLFARHITIFC